LPWRPFDDRTVIRTGYGMYYERVQGNDIYNVAPNPPFSSTATVYNTSLSNPGGGAGAILPPTLQTYESAYPTHRCSSTTSAFNTALPEAWWATFPTWGQRELIYPIRAISISHIRRVLHRFWREPPISTRCTRILATQRLTNISTRAIPITIRCRPVFEQTLSMA